MAEFRLPGALQPGFAVRRGMAGKGRGPAVPARPVDPHRVRRGSEAHAPRIALQGWRSLAFLFALLLVTSAQAEVLSTRIWPAKDYTRLTLESKEPVDYTIFSLKDPERLVIDLETNEISPALAELNGKVAADDPYVQGLRVARNRPGVVR